MESEKQEELIVWQPDNQLKGSYLDQFMFDQISRENDRLIITVKDLHGSLLDIIYDDPDHVCPLEYVVWSFRYNTELGEVYQNGNRINDPKQLEKLDGETFYLVKVKNSQYIKTFHHHLLEKHPDVEHHRIATGDEIFEVIANYQPKFVMRK